MPQIDTYPCKYTIGFCGKLMSGKSTSAGVAQLLLAPFYDIKICSFAYNVKRIAREFGWDGKKDEKGRKLLQLIGTEVGRGYDSDLWVKLALLRMNDVFVYSNKEYNIVLFDDVRFRNEALWIKNNGGVIIKVEDDTFKNDKEVDHISERGISKQFIDFTINNDYNIFWLVEQIHALLNRSGFKTLKAGKKDE